MLYISMLLLIITFIFYICLRRKFYAYFDKKFILEQRIYPDIMLEIETEDIYLKTQDDLRIYCLKAFPNNCRAVIILVHGWGVSHKIFTPLIEYLYNEGYATLSLDLRSRGNSEGKIIGAGYLEQYEVFAAVEYARSISELPIVTIGSSMGGATVLSSTSKVDATIAIAPYSNFFNMVEYSTSKKEGKLRKGVARYFEINYLKKRVGVVDFTPPIERVKSSANRPILIIHAKDDKRVPYLESVYLMEVLQHNAKLIMLDSPNHTPWIFDSDIRRFNENVGVIIKNFVDEQL